MGRHFSFRFRFTLAYTGTLLYRYHAAFRVTGQTSPALTPVARPVEGKIATRGVLMLAHLLPDGTAGMPGPASFHTITLECHHDREKWTVECTRSEEQGLKHIGAEMSTLRCVGRLVDSSAPV